MGSTSHNAESQEPTMKDQMIALIHQGVYTLAVGGLLYAAGTFTAVLVALLAASPRRRRDARKVLALLLRRTTNLDEADADPDQPESADHGR
jgi:hypothetical protein